ncbi:Chorion class B protein Ld34 [Papilio xuthus]|uniref:Chorion class B protein Ld34 n=1 Tax=Papilio xuthus TaxID=66420 RepID=A0A194PU35_PAPXU|nr:Chorion class B protein Ld34 [Papilio xuthus]
MYAKTVFLFCAQTILAQVITCACWGNAFNSGWPAGWAGEGLGWAGPGLTEAPLMEVAPCAAGAPFMGAGWAGYGPLGAAASSGGGFPTSSASPIPPVGLSVASDNAIEGILAVGGELPFLGTVGLEGALPTAGAGAVSYGCGSGAVGMVAEDVAFAGAGWPAAGLGYGPAWAGGLGWASRGAAPFGCGCGAI